MDAVKQLLGRFLLEPLHLQQIRLGHPQNLRHRSVARLDNLLHITGSEPVHLDPLEKRRNLFLENRDVL